MWKPLSPLVETIDQYHGYIIGFAALAAILLLNQLIYRRSWTSYPTVDEYLRAHPGCDTMKGIVCSKCWQRASGGPVIGAGRLYRCAWCDTELYRIDRIG